MKSQLVVVDVETDGPCAGLYSMLTLGAVVVEPSLNKTFYGEFKPFDDARFDPEAMAVGGYTREQVLQFPNSQATMIDFKKWLNDLWVKPIFISDNPAFDWQFVNYYFHLYGLGNPFGFSARRIGDLYSGLTKDMRAKWKHLRQTKHTHNPLDDAKGNAEALLKIFDMGLKQ